MDEELAAIDSGIKAEEEAARQKRLVAEAKAHMEAELSGAIAARGLVVRDFEDEQIREQCVGSSSGARVWFDGELNELHFPVLLLYPETAMSDFIQDVAEGEVAVPLSVPLYRSVEPSHSYRYDAPLHHTATSALAPRTAPSPVWSYLPSCYRSIMLPFHHVTVPSCYRCLLYTSPSPRDRQKSRMPSSA